VRNSWGKYWVCDKNRFHYNKYNETFLIKGDDGYCYIPYDYMTNPDFCFDVWTVRQLASDDFGQEYWDNNDSVNYQHDEEDPDGNEDNNRVIEHYDNEKDVIEDAKKFAEQVLGTFISLAL
jgi:hypothetical protein